MREVGLTESMGALGGRVETMKLNRHVMERAENPLVRAGVSARNDERTALRRSAERKGSKPQVSNNLI